MIVLKILFGLVMFVGTLIMGWTLGYQQAERDRPHGHH